MEFVENIYNITRAFPKEECYGLTTQLRRSAVSIPSNIAEGAARNTKREFKQFLHIALGSLAECETQIEISTRLGYLKNSNILFDKLTEIRRLTQGLIRFLGSKK